jgi:hypothetical protein
MRAYVFRFAPESKHYVAHADFVPCVDVGLARAPHPWHSRVPVEEPSTASQPDSSTAANSGSCDQLCGAFNAAVDLTAQRPKVDRLVRTALEPFSAPDASFPHRHRPCHNNRPSGRMAFAFGRSSRPRRSWTNTVRGGCYCLTIQEGHRDGKL